jgi:hypothetical protein
MWVLSPHGSIAKEGKIPTCVLTPNANITIEKENFNMNFANDMQKLHTLYLYRIGIAYLGFWGFGVYGGIMVSFFHACILR